MKKISKFLCTMFMIMVLIINVKVPLVAKAEGSTVPSSWSDWTLADGEVLDLSNLPYDAGGKIINATGGAKVTIKGGSKIFYNLSIKISGGAEVTIENLNITNTTVYNPPIIADDGNQNNKLIISGTNNMIGNCMNAEISGINILYGNSLIITSNSNANMLYAEAGKNGAGILCKGTITIGDSVNVTARGGVCGAGIGGGDQERAGTIIIEGSGNVTAKGGDYAAGIGGGRNGGAGTITIKGSGKVTATGGNGGAAIGGIDGSITIKDSVKVAATGGQDAAAIGGHKAVWGPTVDIYDTPSITAVAKNTMAMAVVTSTSLPVINGKLQTVSSSTSTAISITGVSSLDTQNLTLPEGYDYFAATVGSVGDYAISAGGATLIKESAPYGPFTVTNGLNFFDNLQVGAKVSFDLQGGTAASAIKDQYVPINSNVSKPTTDPTKDRYTFGGWYKEAACTTPWNFNMDTVIVDTVLYAKWITPAKPANNTVNLSSTVVTAGDTVTITAAGDRQGQSGAVTGDEKYIPTTWSSTETGKSGNFDSRGGSYTASYVTANGENYIVTANYKKQIWNGTEWKDSNPVVTDSKTANVTVRDLKIVSVAAIADISVANGTPLAGIGLPSKVDINLSNSTTTSAIISWDGGTSAYNGNEGEYNFTASIINPAGVANPDGKRAAVKVKVGAAPTYAIALSPSASYTFITQTEGYSSVPGEQITITKTGTGNISGLRARLSGVNSDSFILGELSSAVVNNTTTSSAFSIKPKNGLLAGTYNAVVEVTGDNGVSQSLNISFTVNLVPPPPPTVPTPISDLRAVPGDKQVTLNFTAAQGAASINVQQSIDGINYATATTSSAITMNSTSATVINLTNGQQYSFRLIVTGGSHAGTSNVAVTTPAAIIIPDTTKPIITLIGSSSITVENGATYVDAGATALDDRDGDITAKITRIITNETGVEVLNIDTAKAGTYIVHYKVSDAAGNKAVEVIRTVVVKSPEPVVPTPPLPTPTYSDRDDKDDNTSASSNSNTSEVRTVNIFAGIEGSGTPVKVEIKRTTVDGVKLDTIKLETSNIEDAIGKALAGNKKEVIIQIPELKDNPADALEIQLPKASADKLAESGITLKIDATKAKMEIPEETLKGLTGDVKISIKEITDKGKIDETKAMVLEIFADINGEVKLLGKPVEIEANYIGKTEITIPLNTENLPKDPVELKKLLDSLAVHVKHSNGEIVTEKGKIVYDENGNVVGISITVDSFSTFAIVSLSKADMDKLAANNGVISNRAAQNGSSKGDSSDSGNKNSESSLQNSEPPAIKFVGLGHSPLVEGDEEDFIISSGYDGNVQYRIYLNVDGVWQEVTNGYSAAVSGKDTFTITPDYTFTKGQYQGRVYVKKAGTTGSNQEAGIDFDNYYTYNINCVERDDENRVYTAGNLEITGAENVAVNTTSSTTSNVGKSSNNSNSTNNTIASNDSFKTLQKVTITGVEGISGIPGPYYYRLSIYDVANDKWTNNVVPYSEKLEWTPNVAGTYVLDVHVITPNSVLWDNVQENPTLIYGGYEGWKLKTVKINN